MCQSASTSPRQFLNCYCVMNIHFQISCIKTIINVQRKTASLHTTDPTETHFQQLLWTILISKTVFVFGCITNYCVLLLTIDLGNTSILISVHLRTNPSYLSPNSFSHSGLFSSGNFMVLFGITGWHYMAFLYLCRERFSDRTTSKIGFKIDAKADQVGHLRVRHVFLDGGL